MPHDINLITTIAAALGLTGVAATTVSGALTGALAGGLIGALTGLGFTKEDAELYQRKRATSLRRGPSQWEVHPRHNWGPRVDGTQLLSDVHR